jgi:hypothetical protein
MKVSPTLKTIKSATKNVLVTSYHHLNFLYEIVISGFSEVLNRFGSHINLGKCQKMEKEIKFGRGVKKIRLERT